MKTLKKALSIILGLAMVLSCVAGMQVSAAAEGNIALSVGEATVADGVVTVPVIATGSIQALTATVDYDDAVLTLVKADKVAIEGVDDSAVFGPTDAELFKMQWAFALNKEDVVLNNTTIAILTFNVVDADAKTADITLNVTEAWDVAGNEVAATTAEKETVDLVKEIEVDNNISATAGLNLSSTINLRYIVSNLPADCTDFYVTLSKPELDDAYNFTGNYSVDRIYKSEMTPASGGRYAFVYNNFKMYELNLEIVLKVYCLDAKGNVISVSKDDVLKKSVAQQAKEDYAKASATAKVIYSDILNLASAAIEYFTKKADCYLYNLGLPNKDFVGNPTGDFDFAKLNTINSSNPVVAGTSMVGSVSLPGNPVARFRVSGVGAYSENDLTYVISYVSPKYGEITRTYTKATTPDNFVYQSGSCYALFTDLAFCDGNQSITATLYNGEVTEANKLCSGVYSIEATIASAKPTSTAYPLYIEIAKLGISARAHWGI